MEKLVNDLAPFLVFTVSAFFLRLSARLLWVAERTRLSNLLLAFFILLILSNLFVLTSIFRSHAGNPKDVVIGVVIFCAIGAILPELWIALKSIIKTKRGAGTVLLIFISMICVLAVGMPKFITLVAMFVVIGIGYYMILKPKHRHIPKRS